MIQSVAQLKILVSNRFNNTENIKKAFSDNIVSCLIEPCNKLLYAS